MPGNSPIILCDVDGMFNDFDTPMFHTDGGLAREHLTEFEANGYAIRFDETVLARVIDMHTSGRADVRWLTTWGPAANVHLRERFGFPEDLAVEDGDWVDGEPPAKLNERHRWLQASSRGRWWKGLVVRALMESQPDARVAWLDDDFAAYRRELDWTFDHVDRLLIVETWPSLSHAQLDEIEEFIS